MVDFTKSTVPEGSSGNWAVVKFAVSRHDADFANLRASIHGRSYEQIKAGEYTRLIRKTPDSTWETLVMSDTPMEQATSRWFVRSAEGHVLINGLGLGLVAIAVATKPDVRSVLIVELAQDVIDLVAPTILAASPKITIVQGDAFTFKPPLPVWNGGPYGGKFDWGWHDIWDNICGDNLEQMKKLHRRYGRWVKHQMSWGRDILER